MLPSINAKRILDFPLRSFKGFYFREYVPCLWSKSKNWGDALNPYLISKLSNKKVKYESNKRFWKFLVIGSVIERADSFSIVWGTGMLNPETIPRNKPHSILAVRGPKTRDVLIRHGIACPSVYGDPALLLSRYYKPLNQVKHFKVGIIPHYTDQSHPWIAHIRNDSNVHIIDIYSGIESFVDQLVSCHCILSSSLHGLISADTFGIPNRRLELNSNPRIGGDFKFIDYYSSINLKCPHSLVPSSEMSVDDLANETFCNKLDIDLDKLYELCPFKSN